MNPVIKLSSPETQQYWEIPVLYQDADLLALDKPAGLWSVPAPADASVPSLLKLLHAGIAARKPWAVEHDLSFLMNAHQLDVETSGVLLFARSQPILSKLCDILGTEAVTRRYLALVHHYPEKPQFEITAKLGHDGRREGCMRVDTSHGKRCRTACEIREGFARHTLLECRAFTDRLHQIRVHLRYSRLPVVGDRLYHGEPLYLSALKPGYRLKPGAVERPLIGRAAVHLHTLELPHPASGAPFKVSSPLPDDFELALKYLRRYAAGTGTTDS